MKYKLNFYQTEAGNVPVRDWLRTLPNAHKRALGEAIFALELEGPDLGMPFSRAMGKGLYELRVSCQDIIYRVFYGFVDGKVILLVHGVIKKSQKTPKKDLDLARKRLANYLKGDK